jgi:NAD-dependent dihydropyrimidine dehydrogenase PreA subunit
MVIQVNQELCTGCGVCVDACSVGAIQLVDQWALIDDALCTQCEACVDACPNGAITAHSVPARSTPIVVVSAAESRPVPVQDQVTLPETAAPALGLGPLAGAALAFLGSDVAPRLADVLITALQHRLVRSATTTVTPVSTCSRNHTARGGGERRQARYRRGQTGYRNYEGRR